MTLDLVHGQDSALMELESAVTGLGKGVRFMRAVTGITALARPPRQRFGPNRFHG